jgi:hypothetical protein
LLGVPLDELRQVDAEVGARRQYPSRGRGVASKGEAETMATKAELASAVHSMLDALTVFRDRAGLICSIGSLRAAQFNSLLRQARAALPGVGTVYSVDLIMEYDSVVTLVSRLTILKSTIDHATVRQWLGYRD